MNHVIKATFAAAFAVVALGFSGCADPNSVVTASAPPPPPPREEKAAQGSYAYPHALRSAHDRDLRRKMAVALVRYAEDQPVEGVPFGPKPESEESDSEENRLQMNVQVGAGNVVANDESGDSSTQIRPGAASTSARHILKRELRESGEFTVIERDDVLDILREIRFGQTEYVNPETKPEIGEIMAVQYLLEASIGLNEDRTFKGAIEAGQDYDERGRSLTDRVFDPDRPGLDGRNRELRRQRIAIARQRQMQREYSFGAYLSLFDVRTSEIVAEAYGIGATRPEAVRDAVEELVDLCLNIPRPPRVAWADQERVFVDLGEQDRVKVGDRFRYLSQGKTIRNSAGQVIGNDEREGGVIEITRVDPLMSVGKIVEKTAEPAIGDRIESVK